MSGPIQFIDLQAQRKRLGKRIDRAIQRVLDRGQFIMGPEVGELEKKLADFCGVRHCITCANGTDALALVLMSWGVGPGDAVFVPAFTFVATAEAVALLGATPVFVDVDEATFNMDPVSLEMAVDTTSRDGLRPVAAIPVDLFGQPADYDAIFAIAARHGLRILADAAQSFGGTYKGRKVGALGLAAATSFFPAKPLGCYGDGGAIMTDDDDLAVIVRSLRVHGQGKNKYDNVRIGMNSRLDTIQAAILMEKLAIFPDEIAARDTVARRYTEGLADVATVPPVMEGATSVWAQYTIRVPAAGRDAMAHHLKGQGIPSTVYYPIALTRQTGYAQYPSAPGGTPVSEQLTATVLSLPMHPYLAADQDRVISAVRTAAEVFAGGDVMCK